MYEKHKFFHLSFLVKRCILTNKSCHLCHEWIILFHLAVIPKIFLLSAFDYTYARLCQVRKTAFSEVVWNHFQVNESFKNVYSIKQFVVFCGTLFDEQLRTMSFLPRLTFDGIFDIISLLRAMVSVVEYFLSWSIKFSRSSQGAHW